MDDAAPCLAAALTCAAAAYAAHTAVSWAVHDVGTAHEAALGPARKRQVWDLAIDGLRLPSSAGAASPGGGGADGPPLSAWAADLATSALAGAVLLRAASAGTLPAVARDVLACVPALLLLRAVCIVSTILPRQDGCRSPERFGLRQALSGHCHDKVFSGHTAALLTITLAARAHGAIGTPALLAVNAANVLSLLVTRSHYTIDAVVAVIVAVFVFQNRAPRA